MLSRARELKIKSHKVGKMAVILLAGVVLLSSSPAAWPWTSQPVEAAASEAWIEVNTDSPTIPLPTFGYTYSYDRNGQSLVDDAGQADLTRQAMLNEIRPQWIRFPGSAIANTYDWRRAIGPQNERTRNVDGRIDRFVPVSSAFGPDEAATLMEQAGGTLVMTVPFNSTAQDSADLVEYMNAVNDGDHPWAALRAANGHPLPYGVKYWTIAGESSTSAAAIWTAWPSNGDDVAKNGIAPTSDQSQTWWGYGGERSFTNQKAVRIDSWRDAVIQTQGIESETYYVKFPPVVPDSVSVKIGATPNQAQTWTQVDDFSGSAADSLHYVFDAGSGKITFGDGVHGAIPPTGQFVYVDYVSGQHDSYYNFYNQMKLADPDIVITSDNLILRNMHTADPGLIPLDGLEVRSGEWFADSLRLVNDNYLDEAIGRGYGAFENTIETELAKMDKPSIADVKLALTDAGYSRGLQDAYGNDYAQEIDGAIMRSLMLAQASVNGRVQWMGSTGLFANLDGAAGESGATGATDESNTNEISAQEHAVQMFTTHFGSRLLRTTNVGSATRIVKYWKDKETVSQVEVPGIVALASESTDASTAYVMLINTTRADEVAARIAWRGDRLASFAPVRTWVLDADSLSAATSSQTKEPASAIRSIDPPAIDEGVIRLNTEPASITVIELKKNSPE